MQDYSELMAHPTGALESVAVRTAVNTLTSPERHGSAPRHAVPVGDRGSDIDHVVIGPAGVFTINAKHHPNASVWVGGNTFMVNGQRQPYIRNSRHEAARAGRLLTVACGFPVAVTGLIAVMGAHEGFTVKEQPPGGDVHVMTRREVDRWLRKRDAGVLSPGQVEAVHTTARRSTVWAT